MQATKNERSSGGLDTQDFQAYPGKIQGYGVSELTFGAHFVLRLGVLFGLDFWRSSMRSSSRRRLKYSANPTVRSPK